MQTITDRILSELGEPDLIEKLLNLSKADLNSLLIKIFHDQANKITPVEILKAFEINRFTVPSEIDPVAYHELELKFLALAQEENITPVLLSPAVPFAGSSAFGCVNQNTIVSAVRGTEILSDPTNMLAIIIAEKLKNKKLNNNSPLHYCATTRVLRAQNFPAKKGYYSHFGIFCIVSSGKDRGNFISEQDLFTKQLNYYKKLLIEKFNAKLSVVLRKRSGYLDESFFESMAELVKRALPDVPVEIRWEVEENNYYKGLNFTVLMEREGNKVEIGDGGFVDWTQQMLNNKRERCLISGIGLDRMLI